MLDLPVRRSIQHEATQIPKMTGLAVRNIKDDNKTEIRHSGTNVLLSNLRSKLQNISPILKNLAKRREERSNTCSNKDEIARCNSDKSEASETTLDMDPSTINKQQSSTCFSVGTIRTDSEKLNDSTIRRFGTTSKMNLEEQFCERPKTNASISRFVSNIFLVEANTVKEIRKRTFSHWPHRASPSAAQMIDAGFFCCNVGDRVICIYCNLICQQWAAHSDDPCEVHKILSPKCAYVLAMLTRAPLSTVSIINEVSTRPDSVSSHAIVHITACNPQYSEVPKRLASFSTWSHENLPSVDDLVRAGFFYTGTKTIVTCFYCNGSLQNWGANDKPMIEHARWFPQCAYAQQLCGADLHRKIQESKKAQQERARNNTANNTPETGSSNRNHGQLVIPDENTLSRYVAARLDLPISQSLLDRGIKLSIIKRCWEDQLRLKHDDFISESDLLMACTILQKQIDCINGKKENITVPSVAMKRIREQMETEASGDVQNASESLPTTDLTRSDIEMTYSSKPSMSQTSITSAASENDEVRIKSVSKTNTVSNDGDTPALVNPCAMCSKEEKRLACIPCGHLATCATCGQYVRSCPICHRGVDAFVRIYL